MAVVFFSCYWYCVRLCVSIEGNACVLTSLKKVSMVLEGILTVYLNWYSCFCIYPRRHPYGMPELVLAEAMLILIHPVFVFCCFWYYICAGLSIHNIHRHLITGNNSWLRKEMIVEEDRIRCMTAF